MICYNTIYNNCKQNKTICIFLLILRHSIRKYQEVNNSVSNIIRQTVKVTSYAYNARIGIYEYIHIVIILLYEFITTNNNFILFIYLIKVVYFFKR